MPSKMNSRTRVLTALARCEPDRVPIDYASNPGIDRRLKAHFGLDPADSAGLLQALKVDIRSIYPAYIGPPLHEVPPGRQVNPLGIRTRWIEHESGGYWDYCDFPLRDADEETIARWPVPSPDDFDYAAAVDFCRRHDVYGIGLGGAGIGDMINSTGMIRTMEQVMIDLATGDPAWQLLVDRWHDLQLAVLSRMIELAGKHLSFLWMGEDLGTQDSPMISLPMYRKYLRPRHQRFIDLAKSANLPVMIHTCGSSSWAYGDFIEMGVAAVDTLQPEAVNMAPEYLKQTFGDHLAFHGCISTAGPVATGSVRDVEINCRQMLEIMMPGGGYLFAPTHQLQDNTPTENAVAMYQAALEYGRYA